MIVEWTEISADNPPTRIAMRATTIHAVFEASKALRDAGAMSVVAYGIPDGKILQSPAQEEQAAIVERWRHAWRQAPAGFATMGRSQ